MIVDYLSDISLICELGILSWDLLLFILPDLFPSVILFGMVCSMLYAIQR